MRQIGFCEERGSGIKRAVTAIEKQALPPPTFDEMEDTTIVTLFRERDFGQLSKDQRIYACYLHASLKQVSGQQMSNGSLRMLFGLSERRYTQVSAVISDTIEAKLIKPLDPEQPNRNARYLPFWAS
jgi:predicted HTH transcriptional regulator